MTDDTSTPSIETVKKVLGIVMRGLPREDAALTIFAAYTLIAEEDDEQRALGFVSEISRALWSLKETITNETHRSALAAICAFMDSALAEMEPEKESSPF